MATNPCPTPGFCSSATAPRLVLRSAELQEGVPKVVPPLQGLGSRAPVGRVVEQVNTDQSGIHVVGKMHIILFIYIYMYVYTYRTELTPVFIYRPHLGWLVVQNRDQVYRYYLIVLHQCPKTLAAESSVSDLLGSLRATCTGTK